jgi:hypothetical protein
MTQEKEMPGFRGRVRHKFFVFFFGSREGESHTTGLIKVSDFVKTAQVEDDLIKDGHRTTDQSSIATLRTNRQPILST